MARANTLLEDKTLKVNKPTSSYLAGSTSPNLGITKPVAQTSPAPTVAKPSTQASSVNTAISRPTVDLSGYNKAWEQAQAQYDLQARQTTQSNELALNQLSEQETERKGQTERLAQQAYIARKQSERVLPNVMGAMGTTGTGYENVARQGIETNYENQYSSYMNELNLALASIKRARDSQKMGYAQSMEGIGLNKAQAQQDYQYNVQQANLRADEQYRNALASQQAQAQRTVQQQVEVKASAGNFEKVVQQALKYGSAERSADYLVAQAKAKVISEDDANRIYNEYGRYWAYYNQ